MTQNKEKRVFKNEKELLEIKNMITEMEKKTSEQGQTNEILTASEDLRGDLNGRHRAVGIARYKLACMK